MATTLNHANREGRYVGRSLPRREDGALLRGEATFVGDVRLPDMLHAVFYRSEYAHAHLRRVDLDAVRQQPGVALALAGDDLPRYVKRMAPFPFQSRDPFQAGNPRINFHDRYGLARGKVRYVGEPVALIVAEDRYAAEDALALVAADYEPLPPVLDAEAALRPEAPLLYEEWGENVALRFHVSGGDVDAALAESDIVIEERLQHHRFTGTPIEPRGVVARYDPHANLLELWDSTQIPHVIAALLEDSYQEPPYLKVRVIAPSVGGGFGQKWGFYPEELVVPLAAMLTGRPVKWIETRHEHMVATCHSREQTHHVKLGLRRDGTVLALQDTIYADLGDAYPQGGFASSISTTMYLPGAYKIRHYDCQLYGVTTNKTPFGAHRGFGKSEASFVIERLMDIAAARLGLDPAEIRYRNFIQPEDFPYVCVTGSRYDSGNYPGVLRRALELADYDAMRALQRTKRAEGALFGIGMCLVIEPSSSTRMGSYNSGYFSVTIRMDPTGQVHVATGGNDEGQGHWTTGAQLVAEELGVAPEQVLLREGDSLHTPYGSGSYSSRFSVVGTSGVTMAARTLAEKIRRIAAHLMEVRADDLELRDGRVQVRGNPSQGLELVQIAKSAYHRVHDLPPGEEPGLELTYHYRDPNIGYHADPQGRVAMFSGFPYDAEVAVVEIDPRTGRLTIHKYVSVHDCGNLLNPRIVLGQHLGALAHGIGGALLEELHYDEHGHLRNGSFATYFLPTVMEIPAYTLDHCITPSPFTPSGYKGAGETGTVGPPPCLANAVEDALRPLGIAARRLPLSPYNLWAQIQEAQGNGPAATGASA
ncbi:MAG TPA: xanthine dehydrogenase family protein molybdopterin-binding subunit [Chloroflexota bacterium]|nr:xanthine dehydrogenase family protein molybdopterin-binding subunit [Chloroflexota bacterium]